MKRKVTAFPPAPTKSASIASCSVASLCAQPAAAQQAPSVDLEAIKAKDLTTLLSLLPERHAYSLELAQQLPTLAGEVDLLHSSKVTILRSHVISPGLVEIELQLNGDGNTDIDYSFSSWTIRVGGAGPGLESIDGVLDDANRAPVAVRITVPISHVVVDDIGFVDNAVWSMLPERPTLVEIVTMVANLLQEPQTITTQSEDVQLAYREQWHSAQRHTRNKCALMAEFSKLSQHPYLLGNHLNCEPATVAGWLQPAFVHMVANLKAALQEAACCDHSQYSGDAQISSSTDNKHNISALLNFHNAWKVAHVWRTHVTENSAGIYSFDMFTRTFCDCFIEEVALYEQSALPRRRPNTMNNYGLIMNDIGMHGLMMHLMDSYLVPLVQVLFCEEPVAYGLDHHHSFVVQYKRSSSVEGTTSATAATAAVATATAAAEEENVGTNTADNDTSTEAAPALVPAPALAAANSIPPGDKGLDMHHDSSEVTVNICLGREGFQGGGLRFCGLAGTKGYRKLQYTLQHVLGRAVVHLGRHRHGADDLLPPTPPVLALAPAVAASFAADATSSTTVYNNICSFSGSDIVDAAATDTTGISAATTTTLAAGPVAQILAAERLNLIMWLRSSAFRGAAAYGHIHPDGFPRIPEPEGFSPDQCCLSKFNDADYVKQVEAAAAVLSDTASSK